MRWLDTRCSSGLAWARTEQAARPIGGPVDDGRLGRLVIMMAAGIVVVAGCGGGSSPGWTYAPPSSTAVASPLAESPSAPAGSPPASAPADEVVRVAAKNIAFDQAELTTPAGQPFSLVFDNQEAVPHNVAIYTDASAGQSLFVGEIFSGPDERTYAIPALDAGTYFFRCDVHPTQMTGTLVVR